MASSCGPNSLLSATARDNDQENKVSKFIDDTMQSIMDEFMKSGGRPTITLRRRSSQSSYTLNMQTGALQTNVLGPLCSYAWPGKSMQEAWRFAVTMRILGHISDAIHGNFTTSKRDIYYTDPACFGSQKVVDAFVDDIAFTIGVDRTALHVVAAAKGLMAGSYKIMLKNNSSVDVGSAVDGMLIPRIETIEQVYLSGVRWILVIEKEAVFHRLATSNYHKASAAGNGILITGKGYPDLNTRAFLRLLSTPRNSPPIYILVDSDPDGIAIMSTYKYGSVAQLHENANLNVPTLEWLGLRASDTGCCGSGGGATNTNTMGGGDEALIPLTLRDRKKARAMLERSPVFAEDGPERRWRTELQHMLMVNVKAEIEVLYEREGGIERWLDRSLLEMAW
ncbi:hypothetical protein AJ80_07686 [Polytolypa hystricis UAMH7299]|uniref:DNA topoisomerase (ATP-hydrolyzing) n=1 Tax=Polytolypa hystricis (strain UAMH7299) TaxID=1447883 RepID=A0A2B7XKV2_POLH7|nr:hypothetical protein AJ80_07686 [Polytolypa hystricis UAMH7299]